MTVELLRGGIPHAETAVLEFTLEGPNRILLAELSSTHRTIILDSPRVRTSVDPRAGSVGFHGHNVWYRGLGQVPFLATDGAGRLLAHRFYVLSPRPVPPDVIDPCALVAGYAAATEPRTTPAPWGLPRIALSQIALAGLTPLIGKPSATTTCTWT